MLLLQISDPIGVKFLYDGPVYGFDRVKSRRVDSTVGDDRSKILNQSCLWCRNTLNNQAKKVTANAANDEVFALAA